MTNNAPNMSFPHIITRGGRLTPCVHLLCTVRILGKFADIYFSNNIVRACRVNKGLGSVAYVLESTYCRGGGALQLERLGRENRHCMG